MAEPAAVTTVPSPGKIKLRIPAAATCAAIFASAEVNAPTNPPSNVLAPPNILAKAPPTVLPIIPPTVFIEELNASSNAPVAVSISLNVISTSVRIFFPTSAGGPIFMPSTVPLTGFCPDTTPGTFPRAAPIPVPGVSNSIRAKGAISAMRLNSKSHCLSASSVCFFASSVIVFSRSARSFLSLLISASRRKNFPSCSSWIFAGPRNLERTPGPLSGVWANTLMRRVRSSTCCCLLILPRSTSDLRYSRTAALSSSVTFFDSPIASPRRTNPAAAADNGPAIPRSVCPKEANFPPPATAEIPRAFVANSIC